MNLCEYNQWRHKAAITNWGPKEEYGQQAVGFT